MDGNPALAKLALEVRLRQPRNLGRPAKCYPAFREQANGQVKQRLALGQSQPVQSVIFKVNQRQRWIVLRRHRGKSNGGSTLQLHSLPRFLSTRNSGREFQIEHLGQNRLGFFQILGRERPQPSLNAMALDGADP